MSHNGINFLLRALVVTGSLGTIQSTHKNGEVVEESTLSHFDQYNTRITIHNPIPKTQHQPTEINLYSAMRTSKIPSDGDSVLKRLRWLSTHELHIVAK